MAVTASSKATFPIDAHWLDDAYQQLEKAFNADKMPHGVMLVAPESSGKELFALELSRSILCSNNVLSSETHSLSRACGSCKSCLLVDSLTHPDLSFIDCLIDNKGKQKKTIGIDQVRQLTDKLRETAQLGSWRIAVIASVEKMTRGAFNAILKTLEEPGSQTLIFLLAESAYKVPATIKSRCQQLNFRLSENNLLPWLIKNTECSESEGKNALHATFNAPFAAKDFVEGKTALKRAKIDAEINSIALNELTPNEFLNRNAKHIDELPLLIANYLQKNLVSILKSKRDRKSVYKSKIISQLYTDLLDYNRAQSAGSNLQPLLQIEAILTRWFEMGRKIGQN